ncbi:hypothetical protein [Streptomyces prunicolor]|uniref:hypothetical protein n=1 Tax=Streptomyces prunicolor TaxID=67348 RepID=UPI001FE1F90A|nr:hypothetical protein [Streptomyces prunicolor]
MTDAEDASSIPVPASPELHRLSPRDESRVTLALTLRQFVDAVPVEPSLQQRLTGLHLRSTTRGT